MNPLTSLIHDGTINLPCGVFRVVSSDQHGWDLVSPRGMKALLTLIPAGVKDEPEAVAFQVTNARNLKSLGFFAVLPCGSWVRCD